MSTTGTGAAGDSRIQLGDDVDIERAAEVWRGSFARVVTA